jgi:hypothetical protein
MNFCDQVTIGTDAQLLSDVLKTAGHSGVSELRNVRLWTLEPNNVFIKKKLSAGEAAPVTDGSAGVPVPADGYLTIPLLQLNAVWVYALSEDSPLYIIALD